MSASTRRPRTGDAPVTLAIDIAVEFVRGPSIHLELDLPIDRAAVTVVLGNSGSGKTTLLRCVAGLQRPDRGRIDFGSQTWFDAGSRVHLPPRRRGIGFVFQRPALMPHLNVRQNVAFGLPRQRRGDSSIDEQMIALEIDELSDRRIDQISAGQAQRVSLAQSLILKPRLMLLDEPTASLDASLRIRTRQFLKRCLAAAATPAIIVTHDRDEAAAMADHLVVLDEGRVAQTGTPSEVFARPTHANVAEIVGVETLLHGTIESRRGSEASVRVGNHIVVAIIGPESGPAIGRKVVLCISGDAIALATESSNAGREPTAASGSTRNRFIGTIRSIDAGPSFVRVAVDAEGNGGTGMTLTAAVTKTAADELHLAVGQTVTASFKATAVHAAAMG